MGATCSGASDRRPTLHQQVSICLLAAMHGHFWRHLDACLSDMAGALVAGTDPSPHVIDLAARRELPKLTIGTLLQRVTGATVHDYRTGERRAELWQDRLDADLLDWSTAWARQTARCSTARALRLLEITSETLSRKGLDETRWQQSRREMTLAQLRSRQTPTSC